MTIPVMIIALLAIFTIGLLMGALLATFGWLVYALWITH